MLFTFIKQSFSLLSISFFVDHPPAVANLNDLGVFLAYTLALNHSNHSEQRGEIPNTPFVTGCLPRRSL